MKTILLFTLLSLFCTKLHAQDDKFNNEEAMVVDPKGIIIKLDSTYVPHFVCNGQQIDYPHKLSELNSIDKFVSNVTNSKGLDLSLWGVSGNLSKKDILLISDFVNYRDYHCDEGIKRVAIGLRLYIHIMDLKTKVSVTSLPKISAAVELGKANADYHLQIFGLNDISYKDLPGTDALTVENYAKIISAFDKIISSLNKDTSIDPIIINQ